MAVVLDQVRDDGALVRGHDGQKEKKRKVDSRKGTQGTNIKYYRKELSYLLKIERLKTYLMLMKMEITLILFR